MNDTAENREILQELCTGQPLTVDGYLGLVIIEAAGSSGGSP